MRHLTKTAVVLTILLLLAGCATPVPANTLKPVDVPAAPATNAPVLTIPNPRGEDALTISLEGAYKTLPLSEEDAAGLEQLLEPFAPVDFTAWESATDNRTADGEYHQTGLWLRWGTYVDTREHAMPAGDKGYALLANDRGELALAGEGNTGDEQTALGETLMELAEQRAGWQYVPRSAVTDLRSAQYETYNVCTSGDKDLDESQIATLEGLLRGAQYTAAPEGAFEPICEFDVVNAQGDRATIYVDAHSDRFRLGSSVFCDYGPGEGVDNREVIFSMLGLPDME